MKTLSNAARSGISRRGLLASLPMLALTQCGDTRPERIAVRHDGLVGTLFLPPNPSARPAVVCLTGAGGGLWEAPAQALAAEGFAALALATHHYPGCPAELRLLPVDRVEQAVAWLRKRVAPQRDRVVLRGWSRGGELALLTASLVPSINAVLAYAPRCYVAREAARPNNFNDPDAAAAWTYRGVPQDGVPLGRTHWADPAHPSFEDLHGIAVERINGPVMLVTGQADRGITGTSATYSSNTVIRRLDLFRAPFHRAHYSYSDAGHSIAGPPPFNGPVEGGGTFAGDAAAIANSWPRSLEFLRAVGES